MTEVVYPKSYSQNEEQINELRHQVEKNTKYVKWGPYAYVHDRLLGQRTLKNYTSENIWSTKGNTFDKKKSKIKHGLDRP